jgi:flagellin
MSIIVNTNIQSLFAQRALGKNTISLQKSIEKLSTGSKINRAADDAAGLSISENLNAQIRGLEKANQNAGDGISFIQTAEGSLSVVHDNLQRIRELVVQAKNGSNGTTEKEAIQDEIDERITAIQDIADATKFNGISLLDGSSDIELQVGSDQGQTLKINLKTESVKIDTTAAAGIGTGSIALDTLDVAATTPVGDIDDVDTMITNVSKMRSYLGAVQNSLESRMEYLDVAIENNSASRSRVKDVDVAKESSTMLKNQILQQSAAAMLSQANATPQLALNLMP